MDVHEVAALKHIVIELSCFAGVLDGQVVMTLYPACFPNTDVSGDLYEIHRLESRNILLQKFNQAPDNCSSNRFRPRKLFAIRSIKMADMDEISSVEDAVAVIVEVRSGDFRYLWDRLGQLFSLSSKI